MTTLYTFDGAGYYTGQRDIADPYAPQPAGTATAPPTAPEGQVPMWTGQAWAMVTTMTMGQLFVGMSSLIREQELLVSGA